jgi:hypothetical protein
MTRPLPVILVIGLLAVWPSVSTATVLVSLNNPGSTTLHEISVVPGGTFDVDVNLDTSWQVVGVGCQVRASASGVFDILQNTAKTPWLGGGGVGGLDPTSPDMGWGLPDPDVFPPGAAALASLQIAVDPSAATGTYHLDPVNITARQDRFVMGWFGGVAGPTFVVHVVPEPSSAVTVFILAVALPRRWS